MPDFTDAEPGVSPEQVAVKLWDHVVPGPGTNGADQDAAAKIVRNLLPPDLVGASVVGAYSSLPVETLQKLLARAKAANRDYQPPNFLCYVFVLVPMIEAAQKLATSLAERPEVQFAHVYPHGSEPQIVRDDPDLTQQKYLSAAPLGIDAASAWLLPGGGGENVAFVDIERGWTLAHADLLDPVTGGQRAQLVFGVMLNNLFVKNHGTSVLGIVTATDNTIGCLGVAPNLKSVGVASYRMLDRSENRCAAIAAAAAALTPGDILLIEAQVDETIGGVSTLLPIEVERLDFAAVRLVTQGGIIVIEAAGNGGIDLDAVNEPELKTLNRNDPAFEDSEAILVGASVPHVDRAGAVTHPRRATSNFGKRVDCFAWGDDVFTLTNPAFNGTSAASAIVAGAAASIQGIAKRKRMGPLTPQQMRAFLSDSLTNTASVNGAADKIGVMPNLRSIVTLL